MNVTTDHEPWKSPFTISAIGRKDIALSDINDLWKWMEAEELKWRISPADSSLRICDSIAPYRDQISREFLHYRNNQLNPDFFNSLVRKFSELYAAFPVSNTNEGIGILEMCKLAKKEQETGNRDKAIWLFGEAYGAFGYFSKFLLSAGKFPTSYACGMQKAILIEQQVKNEEAEKMRKAVYGVVNSAERDLQAFRRQFKELEAETSLAKGKFEEQSQKVCDDFRQLSAEVIKWEKEERERRVGGFTIQSTELFKIMKERLEKAEETYKSFKELDAPKNYWRKKSDYHGRRCWAFGSLVAVSVISLLRLLYIEVGYFGKTKPELWQMVIPLSATLLCVWSIRMFYRNYLTHSAAKLDAEERVTMIETYLALKFSSDDNVKKEHMTLVLTSIFRPAVCDIKDDTFPISEAMKAIKSS